ncbi:MAG TPA: nickel pincer cofactor biosynthesis protein LarB [Candidatus Acidoferrales bacterium]|nr:nickel pincer cofactor biosynthesis protein LarB [Candidatus Acidoferrales bacterium]
MSTDEAYEKIKNALFDAEELGYATIDHGRGLRLGLGEVIYGESKSIEQIVGIAGKLSKAKEPILITRLSDVKMKVLQKKFPKGRSNHLSSTFTINPIPLRENNRDEPYVCIITAGTSDIPVAEEAADVCGAMGVAFVKLYDVGVAGIHRVMKNLDVMQAASAVVVIAGMEGALPSVIGGLVPKPIFAVPTDIGYGANFKGLSALLGMLSSCAPGIAVMNINGGFSAAFAACRVTNMLKEEILNSGH